MKKSFLFVAALALTLTACNQQGEVEDKTVATFEEGAISPAKVNSEFKLDTTGVFESGNFRFQQDAQPSGLYYSGCIVSNHTDTTFADWTDAWKSCCGGAFAGKNYLVYNKDWYGFDTIFVKTPAVVPGMYVTNCIYTYNSITKGDDMEPEPFGADDFFTLTIVGHKDGAETGKVNFDLARGTNVVSTWTYVDLSKLGTVYALTFEFSGSRAYGEYLNTPTYFCIDNLGFARK